MFKLLVSCFLIILSSGCLARSKKINAELPVEIVHGPEAEEGFGPFINQNTAHFIAELVIRDSRGARVSFPMKKPFLIHEIETRISYSNLDASCENKDMAIAGALGSDEDTFDIFDIRTKNPALANSRLTFPDGIQADNIYLEFYDDMCHPTNLRITFHASGIPLDHSQRKYPPFTKNGGKLIQKSEIFQLRILY